MVKKIALAEDDPHVRQLIAAAVEELGYACFQCSSGTKALHCIQDNPDIALLITDMVMPELNGEDLIKILRCRHDSRDLPIIIISALTKYEEIAYLLDLGASRFLTKPIDLAELQECLRSLVRSPHVLYGS